MNIGVQFSPICIWFLLHSQKVFCNLKLCINSWWLCEIHDTDQNYDPFLQPLNPQCYSHCYSHPLIDSSFLSPSNHPYSCLLCLLWGCGSRQCIGSSRGFLHYTFVNPSSQWSFCTHSFALTTMYKPVQSVQCPLSTEAYLVDSTMRALLEQGLQCTGSWVPQSLSERQQLPFAGLDHGLLQNQFQSEEMWSHWNCFRTTDTVSKWPVHLFSRSHLRLSTLVVHSYCGLLTIFVQGVTHIKRHTDVSTDIKVMFVT